MTNINFKLSYLAMLFIQEEAYLKRLVKAVEPCKLPSSTATANTNEIEEQTEPIAVIEEKKSAINVDKPPITSERIPQLNKEQHSSSLSHHHKSSIRPHLKEDVPVKTKQVIGPLLPPNINERRDSKSSNEMIEEFDEDYQSWLPPDGKLYINVLAITYYCMCIQIRLEMERQALTRNMDTDIYYMFYLLCIISYLLAIIN